MPVILLKNFVIFQNQARNLSEYYTILDKFTGEKYYCFRNEIEKKEWEDLFNNWENANEWTLRKSWGFSEWRIELVR